MNSDLLLERAAQLAQRIPESAIRRVLVVVPAMVALWLFAGLCWQFFLPSAQVQPWRPDLGQKSGSALDVSGLDDYPMFGVADAKQTQTSQVVVDAPQTTLKLRLTGLVAESETGTGVAIIESQNNQMAYQVGDVIKGTSAKVQRILWDRVLLDNSGKTEALMLDGKKYKPLTLPAKPEKPAPPKAEHEPRHQTSVTERSLRDTLDRVRGNPQSLADMVHFTPKREGDQISGYQVEPGRDPRLFQSLGLKSGDLVKSINGYDLTDPAQALDIMGQLSGLDSINLQIERNGQPQSLTINVEK
ncbi:type II secretion system protein GspC [Gallaecimonas mangrovi]|uniref:type II secretion system protein GspC n=1 Tax=Gallaecimonas mangrovi TaxID=2291597 RepID=UPI000E2062B0|nr:type II secretion system protein GspC [Gallaecimonas mangrovi]